MVNAPDCDSGIHGFNPHMPPHFFLDALFGDPLLPIYQTFYEVGFWLIWSPGCFALKGLTALDPDQKEKIEVLLAKEGQ